jgi:SAM-dependent methyltransferase
MASPGRYFAVNSGERSAIADPATQPMAVHVQYGCGQSCPVGWLNFDNSPTLRLRQLPIIGGFFRRAAAMFPADVRYGDIVKGLPMADGSADCIYASHVLEHLSLTDFWTALDHTFRLLKPDGLFRLLVPDLEARARKYLEKIAAGDEFPNSWFMRSSSLGSECRPRGLEAWARAAVGNSAHLWMWDEKSMTAALTKSGFVDVRRCRFNDSQDAAFLAVEDFGRFHDDSIQLDECAMEARKPSPSMPE